MIGARYQIAVDGKPRSNRDDSAIAIEAGEYLKFRHPHAEVTVHDLVTGDTITISATDRRSRHLTVAERRALTRAIAQLRPASLPPFSGTCPIAYDGQERIYRFRGKSVLRSCTYDLRNVQAVRLADRLLASLPAR